MVVWCCFHCLLRPGEGLNLRKRNVRFARSLGSAVKVVVLVIEEAKTRRKAARTQHVLVEEPLLVRVLEAFCATLNDDDFLFPLSAATFGKRFEQVLARLGVPGWCTPAGLRAGGATEEWLRYRDFHTLRLRGRWMVVRTLEHYLQECVATLGEGEVPATQMEFISAIAAEGRTVWDEFLAAR